MVEYGGGIGNGPAGQVSGSGGSHPLGHAGSIDFGASVGGFVTDSVNWVSSLPPGGLLLLVVGVFAGLIILRRVF
jgi:hypothetical protein